MSGFSIGETLVSGFGLVVRRPVAVLIWGLVCLAIMILPLALVFGPLLGELPSLVRAAQAAGPTADASDAMGLRIASGFLLALPLLLIAGLVAQAVISGAIYRSVLEPDNRSWASLRFGAQELWLMLLAIVRSFLFGFMSGFIVLGALLICGLGLLVTAWLPQPWAGVLRAPFFIAAIGGAVAVSVWVWLRLSLAAPMTFAERQFRLFESWTVTRGRVKELLGLGVLMLIIRQGLPIVLVLPVYACFALLLGTSVGFFDFAHAAGGAPSIEADPAAILAAVTPVIVIVVAIVMLAIGALQAVFLAPWAVVYRELSRHAKPEHPPVF